MMTSLSLTSVEISVFFDMWNRLVINYLRAKFYCDTTIITCNAFFMYVFGSFQQVNRGFSVMTSLSVTSQSH